MAVCAYEISHRTMIFFMKLHLTTKRLTHSSNLESGESVQSLNVIKFEFKLCNISAYWSPVSQLGLYAEELYGLDMNVVPGRVHFIEWGPLGVINSDIHLGLRPVHELSYEILCSIICTDLRIAVMQNSSDMGHRHSITSWSGDLRRTERFTRVSRNYKHHP